MNFFSSAKKWFASIFGRKSFYCPSCGTFNKLQQDCPKCMVPLLPVDKYYMTENNKPLQMVTVFMPENMAQLAVAKAILDDAGIPYYVKNEISQNLFGAGMVGAGFNTASGAMAVEVAASQAEEAAILLSDL
ncbi:MAG: DUF2007 domain-containing protein [Fibrobacteres bacterium]|nr:DUF2007 domain-containing protein [Fibrobacterota bacterium]